MFEGEAGAVKLQGEKGDVKLTVAPLGSGSREFLVYALPQSVFESLENGLDGMLENNFTTVKSDYDRYFLMDVVQKEANSSADDQSAAPTILKMNYLPVECKKDKSKYGFSYQEHLATMVTKYMSLSQKQEAILQLILISRIGTLTL